MNTKSDIISEILYLGKKCISVSKIGYKMVWRWVKGIKKVVNGFWKDANFGTRNIPTTKSVACPRATK